MNEQRSSFWFPVKRYGWGWGPPVRWQGWAVLAVYATLIYVGIYNFKTVWAVPSMIAYLVALTAALVAIVVAKGERPVGWRWGKK